MLVPSKVSWWRLVFAYKGSELPRTKYRIAGVLVVSIFVTILEELHDWHPNLKPLPFTLIGVALGIFLGFRNNASYDRWWEGRKLWGSLVNTTRTFTRQVLTIVGTQPEGPRVDENELRAFQREIVLRIAAFAHALRLALRDEDDLAQLAPFLPADEIELLRKESNRPFAITQGTAERIRAAWQRGWIHTMHLPVLEQSMTALTDIQGGCERIKATPIPFSYTTLIHRITAVYCYALPFGLVDEIGIYTPFAVGLVAYAFFGLDVVGDEIEMPFGTDPNDLPLRAISRMIEVNLRQRIGDPEPPPLLRPVDELLD
ncbi:bestrophin family protein [Sandaracinus amylolyticus]|uniref:bestrophin family protein n=1 Tax=Sandaracinus amylolyticus TaxID=927083 RepID=UPI001F3078FE|nr:bestrophin family protein [Sandaracinus amylolyticus]UJR79718.1 Bestrophin, RFP-TM, chloride channel [Sandaracinus amylolyticus]